MICLKLGCSRRFALIALALAVQLLVARTLQAQTGESATPAPDANIREILDLPVMDIRSEEQIGELRTETAERLKEVQGSLAEANKARDSGQARVEVQKTMMEKMKADYKLATQQGTAVPKKTHEAQIKRSESALKLLDQYDRTLSAKIDAFAAQRDSYQALLEALDREAAVSSMNRQMTEIVKSEGLSAGARLGSMQNELTKLEHSSLEGIKKRTEKEKTASEKLYKLMEERLKFAEMRSDFLAGK